MRGEREFFALIINKILTVKITFDNAAETLFFYRKYAIFSMQRIFFAISTTSVGADTFKLIRRDNRIIKVL